MFRIDESVRMLRICMGRIPDSGFWERENPSLNSMGNLLLHLSGNIRQYVISGLGDSPDNRDRDAEFGAGGELSRDIVWKQFSATVQEAREVIRRADSGSLLKKRRVQGFTFSGMGLVIHAVEHLSYHTGQVAYLVKARNNEDLGFYDGVDLTVNNT
nr:DUF1572 family protein [Robiginitalea sp. SC105]